MNRLKTSLRSRLKLSRRTFLGTSGTAMALPLLEAMLPVGKTAFAQSDQPTRFIAYFSSDGAHMDSWTPTGEGTDFQLNYAMQPLADLKSDILIPTGLANRPGKPDDNNGDHAGGCGCFLTNVAPSKSGINNGISIDQVMANHANVGGQTRFASFQLGVEGGRPSGGCDSGYSCAYTTNISWSGPQTPVITQSRPDIHFDRMFSGGVPEQSGVDAARRKALNQSVIDYVYDDIKRLESKLGNNDKQKLEEYLASVKAIERTLQSEQVASGPSCVKPNRPSDTNDRERKADIFADLMVLAFQCDLTRVQTFMLTSAQSYRTYSFLKYGGPVGQRAGLTGRNLPNTAHHDLSHHAGNVNSHAALEEINRFNMESYAYLIRKLKNTTDASGQSLLASSIVFASNEISDGNMHNHSNMPVIIGGQGNGAITTGRHIKYRMPAPNRDFIGPDYEANFGELFITFADAMGCPINSFGRDGKKPLEGLRA